MSGLLRIARRLERGVTDEVGLAQALNQEHARQMSAQAGAIPVRTGELRHVLTTPSDPRRRVVIEGGGRWRVSIALEQAYWQRHNIPRLDRAQVGRVLARHFFSQED